MSEVNRSFSLLTCSDDEFAKYCRQMLDQEKVESAALKWTRSDIRRIRKLRPEVFDQL